MATQPLNGPSYDQLTWDGAAQPPAELVYDNGAGECLPEPLGAVKLASKRARQDYEFSLAADWTA